MTRVVQCQWVAPPGLRGAGCVLTTHQTACRGRPKTFCARKRRSSGKQLTARGRRDRRRGMSPSGPVEFLSRRDRARRYAFDCPSLIYFKDWVPGGEYVVRLSHCRAVMCACVRDRRHFAVLVVGEGEAQCEHDPLVSSRSKRSCSKTQERRCSKSSDTTTPHPTQHTWRPHPARIRYVLPESKYFSMAFPDPIRLASGNSVTVDVVFRPVVRLPATNSQMFHRQRGALGLAGGGARFDCVHQFV